MRHPRCARCKKPVGDPYIRVAWIIETGIGPMDEEDWNLCLACNQFVAEAIRGAVKMPRKPKVAAS